MKKLFFIAFTLFLGFSLAQAANTTNAKETPTPASIYAKIQAKSYVGKYSSIILDKEMTSTKLPKGMSVKSKTYFLKDRFREETITKDANNKTVSIVTIFTSSDTYISYDSGENYFSLGMGFMDKVKENIKDIDPFTPEAKLQDKTETINGIECYVIDDLGGGLNRRVYVDAKNYNIIKSITANDEMKVITDLSNYKKVKDFEIPLTTKVVLQQMTGNKEVIESTIKLTDVKIDTKLNASLFVPKNVTPLPDIPGMNIKELLESMF